MTQVRLSRLGGEVRQRNLFGAYSNVQVVILVVLGVAWIFALAVTQSLVVVVAGLLLIGILAKLMPKVTASGDSWAQDRLDRLVTWWRHRTGRIGWKPEHGLPASVGDLRELTLHDEHAPVVFVHQPSRKGRFADPTSSVTAVLEIVGGGDGLREIDETNRRGEIFNRLLMYLASAAIPVEQLDVETRVLPTNPAMYEQHMAGLLAEDCPPALRASMDQLAKFGADATETYRTFATIRMAYGALRLPKGLSSEEEALTIAAADALRPVVERFSTSGYRVRTVMGPRRYAAMVRHMWVPNFSLDELDGVECVTDGWAFPYTNHQDAVQVHGPVEDWWHAVASVPRDAWPMDYVGGRWLEKLVTDVNPRTIRTVKASHVLVARRKARSMARVGLTYDMAALTNAGRRGKVDASEDEASASASRQMLADINRGAAGDQPHLRVLVSAPTHEDLMSSREAVETAADDAGLLRLRWHRGRHHQAMTLMAPLGRH